MPNHSSCSSDEGSSTFRFLVGVGESSDVPFLFFSSDMEKESKNDWPWPSRIFSKRVCSFISQGANKVSTSVQPSGKQEPRLRVPTILQFFRHYPRARNYYTSQNPLHSRLVSRSFSHPSPPILYLKQVIHLSVNCSALTRII